ncbi:MULTISPECIES: FtsX-like permease family protein [Streptomyces]|uniref:FtsX-like permease family protein n=1 Tax=Streptomyces TaxID=1883 RepID=UPI00069AF922|nr:FtsX-like permease family protein [Streptomyces sp. SID7805]MYU55045.1 ABC transporter permease [Streptomyces sp. SID7805]
MSLLRSPAGRAGRRSGDRGHTPPARRDPPAPLPATARTGPVGWAHDLLLGMRFAAGGGREGWIRTALTAVGVALGVAVLLLGTSVPTLMDSWHGREKARENLGQLHPPAPADDTILYASTNTVFHGEQIRGRLIRPDGAHPPVPPGIDRLPGPGRMMVSPALKELLDAPGSALLRARLDYEVAGVIRAEGLRGPAELTYYAGSATLNSPRAYRIDHFGKEYEPRPMQAPTVLLVVMTCVALLMPVMVFLGTSVRYGNERRERRLAALRLVGADVPTTRRIASGEALFGSLLGLAGGAGLFLGGRQFASVVTLWDVNVFPADIAPSPLAAALIAVLVPAVSVVVTLFAQRGITVEPLGVVRHRPPVRRRLWWRVLLPLVGALLLVPMSAEQAWTDTPLNTLRLTAGSVLLLFGVTALLPWLVDAVVGRLRGGPVPWQLATRRLQLNSGSATRAVSGITVALAGAIAIQMLLTGMKTGYADAYAQSARERPDAGIMGSVDSWQQAERALTALRATPGVTDVRGTVDASFGELGHARPDDRFGSLAIGSCAELRKLAALPSCRDGDVFRTGFDAKGKNFTPGMAIDLNPQFMADLPASPRPWKIPPDIPTARLLSPGFGPGNHSYDLLATPSAIDLARFDHPFMDLEVNYDHADPDTVERIRNSAARVDPTMYEHSEVDNPHDAQISGVRDGLFFGSVVVLLLIGAGLVISTVEQLHERRRLLSALDAIGTRRATLGWSVLWQTAIPVALGLGLALGCGLALGSLLLAMIDSAVMVDWAVVVGMTGVGGVVILFVTALSLPPLWRMMRPEGLRTE